MKEIPPLEDITLTGYSRYVEEKVRELKLDNYFIAGLSFGFAVVNNMQLDKQCKGILAISPYLNSKVLKINVVEKYASLLLLELISILNLYNFFWTSRLFKYYLRLVGLSSEVASQTIHLIHPRAFFKTARLILTERGLFLPKSVPHVLIMNDKDTVIQFDAVIKNFRKNMQFLLVPVTMQHTPEEMNYTFFQSHISEDVISKIVAYFMKQ